MTKIKMNENYTQTTRYSGILNEHYPFTIDWDYSSVNKTYEFREIIWTHNEPKKNIKKSESLIKDFVSKWLFGKPVEETER